MELIKVGKTKDVYSLEDGNILLRFKDTVTGNEDGSSDPGGNLVVGEVSGVGSSALNLTSYYFNILKNNYNDINTHFVSSDLNKNEMVVKKAKMFGNGLEFVVRYFAYGSFIRRFGMYINEFEPLDGLLEVTLKDDKRNDPPLTLDILKALKLMTEEQFLEAKELVKKVCNIVKEDLLTKNLTLVDIKVEVGLVDGKIGLIDEISAGNMRVFENDTKLDYFSLTNKVLNAK